MAMQERVHTLHKIWKWIKRMMAGLLVLVLALTALTYAGGAFTKRQLARENLIPGQRTYVGEYNMHIPGSEGELC